MLKMVITVHRTEEMWLSRYQDSSVRDGTLNRLISTINLPRGKMHRGNVSFVINDGVKTF